MLAGTLEAELLAFFLTGVSAEQVGALQRALDVFVHDRQGLGNTEANRLDLTIVATTRHDGADIVLVDQIKDRKRFLQLTE